MIWWDQVSTHLGAKVWGTLMVCVLVHCHVIMRWASGPQYIWAWNLLVCSSSSLLLWSKRQRPGSTLVLWHLEGSIFRGEEGAFQDYQSLVREEMCYSQTGSFWPKGFQIRKNNRIDEYYSKSTYLCFNQNIPSKHSLASVLKKQKWPLY